MKFQLLDLPFGIQSPTQVQIRQTKNESIDAVNTFLSNHGLLKYLPVSEETFLCEYNDNGVKEIVGVFSFSNEDIRKQFPNIGNDSKPRNYHRLYLLVLDLRLLNEFFLSNAFMVMPR